MHNLRARAGRARHARRVTACRVTACRPCRAIACTAVIPRTTTAPAEGGLGRDGGGKPGDNLRDDLRKAGLSSTEITRLLDAIAANIITPRSA